MTAIMLLPDRNSDIGPSAIVRSPGRRSPVYIDEANRREGGMPAVREVSVSLTVNGAPRAAAVPARTLLVHLLRDHLGLTGTHVGCDTTQCGACTVALDGVAVKSCTVLAAQVDGCEVTTIEGLATEYEAGQ